MPASTIAEAGRAVAPSLEPSPGCGVGVDGHRIHLAVQVAATPTRAVGTARRRRSRATPAHWRTRCGHARPHRRRRDRRGAVGDGWSPNAGRATGGSCRPARDDRAARRTDRAPPRRNSRQRSRAASSPTGGIPHPGSGRSYRGSEAVPGPAQRIEVVGSSNGCSQPTRRHDLGERGEHRVRRAVVLANPTGRNGVRRADPPQVSIGGSEPCTDGCVAGSTVRSVVAADEDSGRVHLVGQLRDLGHRIAGPDDEPGTARPRGSSGRAPSGRRGGRPAGAHRRDRTQGRPRTRARRRRRRPPRAAPDCRRDAGPAGTT